MLLMIKTLFKPTPLVQDAILSLCMATLSPRSLARMGTYSVVALLSLPVPMLLYLVDYYLFLEVGSAPANYMFFQCLAYNLFLGIIYIDMIAATTKRDKALRITESEMRKEKSLK
jgi:GPI-anchor transamidase subunit U